MKKANIIEINGQRFHADSGELVDAANIAIRPLTASESAKPAKSVVGAVASNPVSTIAIPISQPDSLKASSTPKAGRSAAKSVAKRVVEPSHTLMRHAVKKPTDAFKRHTKVNSPTTVALAKPVHATKALQHSISVKRLERAQAVSRSQSIHRFTKPVSAYVAPIAKPQVLAHAAPPPIHGLAPAKATHQAPVGAASGLHTVHRSAQYQAKANSLAMFEQAIFNSTSHRERPVKPIKKGNLHFVPKKVLRIASASLAVLLLLGFLGYQNQAAIGLHQASSKAGFTASLPSYKPSGFSLGHFSYSAGSVAINFHSNSDQRSFAIVEKPSSWDNNTLVQNVVASAAPVNNDGSPGYETLDSTYAPVYTYGDTATWIKGGIWYSVTTHSNALSNTQITELANSL